MAYFDSDLAKCLIDILGETGPFEIDTNIASHNCFLEYKKQLKKDKIKIGHEGKSVTKDDIKKFLKKAEKYSQKEILNNGRSYFFEGVEKTGNKSYAFIWGS